MGFGSSKTSSATEDNKIVQEGDGVALAKGASYEVNNEFSDNAVKAFEGLLNTQNKTIDALSQTTSGAGELLKNAINKVTESQAIKDTGGGSLLAKQSNAVLIASGATMLGILYFLKGK